MKQLTTTILNWTYYNFYPNLDKNKFDEYKSWYLTNVLNRPLYTSQCNYWLNPVSAGIETCIKVHNLKAKGVARLLKINKRLNFNENLSMVEINNLIKTKSDNYAKYLKTINLDDQIEKLVLTNIQC